MNIEDRLKDELDREGRRSVDVDRLYASTRERIDAARRRRVKPVLVVAASAAAVVGIAAGGLWLDGALDGEAHRGEAVGQPAGDPPQEGPVDKTFTCPSTTTVHGTYGPINVSRPGLGWKGIERYKFVRTGADTGVLRVGLADNSLAAKVSVTKQDRWVVDRVLHCTGPEGSDVGVDGRFRLGTHGRAFPEPPKFQPDNGEPRPDSSVQPVDDRAFYNEFGVVDRRTVFAHENGKQVKVLATDGELDYYEYSGFTQFGDGQIANLEYEFLYDVPGGLGQQRDRDFLFVGYYTRVSGSLTAELEDGSTVDAEPIRGDDWKGTLYALLAPRDQVEKIVVERDGETKAYEPAQIH